MIQIISKYITCSSLAQMTGKCVKEQWPSLNINSASMQERKYLGCAWVFCFSQVLKVSLVTSWLILTKAEFNITELKLAKQ